MNFCTCEMIFVLLVKATSELWLHEVAIFCEGMIDFGSLDLLYVYICMSVLLVWMCVCVCLYEVNTCHCNTYIHEQVVG